MVFLGQFDAEQLQQFIETGSVDGGESSKVETLPYNPAAFEQLQANYAKSIGA